METPIVKPKTGISPIWILPLVAILIGAYLIYKDYQESGIMITVAIKDANGLTEGKTQVFFKGLPVGTLKSFSVSPDLKYINAEIEMVKQAREKLTKDTLFWVVRPEISMNRITGLDTLIKGSYFEVQPGNSREQTDSFTALPEPPPISTRVPGLHLTLHNKDSVSLEAGSPVSFKKIAVGEIVSNRLLQDGTIKTRLLIYPQYVRHVTSSSKFFISSGIRFQANLPKITVEVDPIKTILRGGISFFTPAGGEKVDSKNIFPLYSSMDDALRADDIKIHLTFSADHGLQPDAEIRFNGIQIGHIADIEMKSDLKTVLATAYIDKSMEALLVTDAYFWTVNARFNAEGISNLDTLIKGAYVNILPGTGKSARTFVVHNSRPVNITDNTGLNLVLETDRLGSLGYNKPVYYRQVQVGHTTGYELSPTGQNVLIYLNVHEPYVNLVRENTKFWNSTGFRIKGGLMTEMRISTESVAAIIGGGISFSTPDKDNMGNRVANGKHFVLHRDPDDKWLTWSPPLSLGKMDPAQPQEKENNE